MAAKMQPRKKRLSAVSDDGQLAPGGVHNGGDNTPMLRQQQLAPGGHEALPYAYLPVAMGRKRKKTSWVWNHFAFGGGENARNVCKHCLLANPSDATSYPRSTGNSTLAVHLHTKHGIVRENGGGGGGIKSNPGIPTIPTTPATPATPAAPFITANANGAGDVVTTPAVATGITTPSHGFKTPPTKAESDNRTRQQQQQNEAVSVRRQAEIVDALLDFLVDEQLGCDVLESASFAAFAKKLNPSFQLPTRDAFAVSIDKQLAQALQKVSAVVQEIPGGVALTLDRWSTPGYVGVTLHWVSSDWELKKRLLEFKHSPPQFDAWAVTELLMSTLQKFNLSTRVRAITTDMGSELEPAVAQVREALDSEFVVQVSDAWHLRCVSHILQQCVSAALEKIAVPLASLRTLVKLLHDSDSLQKAYKLFQQQQRATGSAAIREDIPVLDVENKWDALFAMIDAAYDVKDVLNVLFASNAMSGLRSQHQQELCLLDADWRTLKCVKDFLEQAVGYTVVVEDDYISASLLPLIYDSLQAHCKKTVDGRVSLIGITPLAKSAASAFLDVLQRNKRHLWNHFANLAQILDPRVANASVEAVAMKAEIRRTLIEEYGLDVQESSSNSVASATASSSASTSGAAAETTTPIKAEKQISSLFAAARQARNEIHPERVTEDEVDAFFKFTANADLGCDDVLEWWKVVGAPRFPKMSLLARDTLMIMGSALPASAFTGSDRLVSRLLATVNDVELEMATKVRTWNRFERHGEVI